MEVTEDALFYAHMEKKYRNVNLETVTIDDCESVKDLCYVLQRVNENFYKEDKNKRLSLLKEICKLKN